MARIRTIKPEFFRHEGLYELEQETGLPIRVAFAGLWTAADREGRFVWSPRTLKLDCLPHDNVEFSRVLDALATRGFVIRYCVEEKDFGAIPSWKEHQAINNKERPSFIPEPTEDNKVFTRKLRVEHALDTRDDLFQGEGKGRERKGREKDAPPSGEAIEITNSATLTEEADYFRRAKQLLGPKKGGWIGKKLLIAKGAVYSQARSALEAAASKGDPETYILGIINRDNQPKAQAGHPEGPYM